MDQTQHDEPWLRITLGSFATLVCVVLAWNAAAVAIDASELRDGGAWVYMTVFSIVGTVFFGAPAMLVCLGAVVGAAAFESPSLARACAGLSALVSAACAAGVVWLGAPMVSSATPTEIAFGAASLLLALVLLMPLLLCIRRVRRQPA